MRVSTNSSNWLAAFVAIDEPLATNRFMFLDNSWYVYYIWYSEEEFFIYFLPWRHYTSYIFL